MSPPTAKKYSETRPKPQRHHAWWIAIFIAGTLVPPIAVAMRFGITRDFWINCVMMILGYFPSHGHNYLQNIRDNTGRGRTPQWALDKGLIEPDKVQSQNWANKYSERTNDNPYDDDDNASIHSARSNRAVAKPASRGGIEAARRNRYHGTDSSYGGSNRNASGSIPEARDLEREADQSDRHSFTRGASRSSTLNLDNDSTPGMERTVQKKKSGGFLGLFGGNKEKKDRFTKEREAREGVTGMGMNGSRGDDEYGDEFERQINGGARRPTNDSSSRSLARDGAEVAPREQTTQGDGLHHTF